MYALLFNMHRTPSFLLMHTGGGDIVDYPLTVLPRRQGTFSGAVAFVAQVVDTPHRYILECECMSSGGCASRVH